MNPWLGVNRATLRAMLGTARVLGATKFEAYTDSGEFRTLTDHDEIIAELMSVDLSALVCVDPDGTRRGHFQLTIGQEMICDYVIDEAGRAEAVADAGQQVEEEMVS